MVNRTQALVLGFFLVVLGSVVMIWAAAPDVYDQALSFPPKGRSGPRSPSCRLKGLGLWMQRPGLPGSRCGRARAE